MKSSFVGSLELGARKRQNTGKQQINFSGQGCVSRGKSSGKVLDNQSSGKDSDNQNSKKASVKRKSRQFPPAPSEYVKSFQKPDQIFTEHKLIENFPNLRYYGMEEFRNEESRYIQDNPPKEWTSKDYWTGNPDLSVYLLKGDQSFGYLKGYPDNQNSENASDERESREFPSAPTEHKLSTGTEEYHNENKIYDPDVFLNMDFFRK